MARSRPRARPLVALLIATTLAITLGPAPASGATTAERRSVRLVNAARDRHSRPPLRLSERVSRMARRHSARMAERGTWFHHRCLDCIRRRNGWSWIGENVGYASSVRALHGWFMDSDGHRANILCRCFRRIGVGVVSRGGRVYVTQIFYRP